MYLPKLFLYCLKDFPLTGELFFSGQAVHSVTFPHFSFVVWCYPWQMSFATSQFGGDVFIQQALQIITYLLPVSVHRVL